MENFNSRRRAIKRQSLASFNQEKIMKNNEMMLEELASLIRNKFLLQENDNNVNYKKEIVLSEEKIRKIVKRNLKLLKEQSPPQTSTDIQAQLDIVNGVIDSSDQFIKNPAAQTYNSFVGKVSALSGSAFSLFGFTVPGSAVVAPIITSLMGGGLFGGLLAAAAGYFFSGTISSALRSLQIGNNNWESYFIDSAENQKIKREVNKFLNLVRTDLPKYGLRSCDNAITADNFLGETNPANFKAAEGIALSQKMKIFIGDYYQFLDNTINHITGYNSVDEVNKKFIEFFKNSYKGKNFTLLELMMIEKAIIDDVKNLKNSSDRPTNAGPKTWYWDGTWSVDQFSIKNDLAGLTPGESVMKYLVNGVDWSWTSNNPEISDETNAEIFSEFFSDAKIPLFYNKVGGSGVIQQKDYDCYMRDGGIIDWFSQKPLAPEAIFVDGTDVYFTSYFFNFKPTLGGKIMSALQSIGVALSGAAASVWTFLSGILTWLRDNVWIPFRDWLTGLLSGGGGQGGGGGSTPSSGGTRKFNQNAKECQRLMNVYYANCELTTPVAKIDEDGRWGPLTDAMWVEVIKHASDNNNSSLDGKKFTGFISWPDLAKSLTRFNLSGKSSDCITFLTSLISNSDCTPKSGSGSKSSVNTSQSSSNGGSSSTSNDSSKSGSVENRSGVKPSFSGRGFITAGVTGHPEVKYLEDLGFANGVSENLYRDLMDKLPRNSSGTEVLNYQINIRNPQANDNSVGVMLAKGQSRRETRAVEGIKRAIKQSLSSFELSVDTFSKYSRDGKFELKIRLGST